MSILYQSGSNLFKLDSLSSSYAFRIAPTGHLIHLYYGAKLPDTDLSYLSATPKFSSISPLPEEGSGFSLDISKAEYPCSGCGDFRQSALSILRSTGTDDTDIRYVSHKIYQGKPKIQGLPATYAESPEEAETLELLCRDAVSGAEVTLFYSVFADCAAICRWAKIENTSEVPMDLCRVFSASFDLPCAESFDMIHLHGYWAEERTAERAPLIHAIQTVSSKRGCSSHCHNPFVALCSHDATEESGEAYGFSLIYSGNFEISTEVDSKDTVRLLMGINPQSFRWHLEPGEVFYTPEAVSVYSSEGLGGMSRTYHKLYRQRLCRGPWKNRERPILVNNWEATYFDFNEEKLYQIAKKAKELGIEMLVMDDGWFGKRNNDSSSLGDWTVNKEKLPGGLGALTKRITDLGMKFGIWFEPEMISPDSDLFRKHPDWAIGTEGRPRSVGRHQYVLDMTREDVQDYLFESIRNILDSADISYVKWDFNRNLTEVSSALLPKERQQEFFHRYVLGLYALLERIVDAYPDLLLEGCAGGGGRFDGGWLYYAPQIWTSDDSDAIERLNIQYGTSLCYPPSAMGAHVSACPNHQIHRTTPLAARANVAMEGSFGYELDLGTLTEEEQEAVRQQCRDYHKYYQLTHSGNLYRIVTPLEDTRKSCWCFVSEDRKEALLTFVLIRRKVQEIQRIRLRGLNPGYRYRNEQTGQILSGQAWMQAGLLITHTLNDFDSVAYHFTAVDEQGNPL